MSTQELPRTFTFLRLAGALFLVVLPVWVGYTLVAGSYWRPAPQVLGLGTGFEGSLRLPKEEIEAGLKAGREAVLRKNSIANVNATVAATAGWVSFLLSSLISLAAGYHGVVASSANGVDVSKALKNRSAKFTRRVGLLAAGAAVCTALNGRAAADAERDYKAADELQRKITQSRRAILDAPDADAAQAVLDQLRQEAAR